MNNKEVNTDSIAPADKLVVYGFEEIEELTREEKQELLKMWKEWRQRFSACS